MFKIIFSNNAILEIEHLCSHFIENSGKTDSFLNDLEKTFNIIENNANAGEAVHSTSYENIRCIHLEKYTSIRIIYEQKDNDIIVHSVMIHVHPA